MTRGKKILVVSENYPSKFNKTYGLFVYKLVQELALLNCEVMVIAPIPLKFILQYYIFPNRRGKGEYGEERAKVLRPLTFSFGQYSLFNLNTFFIGHYFSKKAIQRALKKFAHIQVDVTYFHFIWTYLFSSDLKTSKLGMRILGVGEFLRIDDMANIYGVSRFVGELNKIDKIIAVSTSVKEKLIDYGLGLEKISVEPNGVNTSDFRFRDKLELRRKYGFDLNAKIIVFVGRFVEDKGPHILLKALNGSDIQIILIGSGKLKLVSQNIVFKGEVVYSEMPIFLSMADLFVLPTLHEGSSNATIEAMACGLPIVTSDLPEMREILSNENAVFVNPRDVENLRDEVLTLLTSESRMLEMGEANLKRAENYSLRSRAKRIFEL